MVEEYEPVKGLYQIFIVNRETEEIILDVKQVAYSEAEALKKAETGKALKNKTLRAEGVDLYIRLVGCLYEGIFNEALEGKEK